MLIKIYSNRIKNANCTPTEILSIKTEIKGVRVEHQSCRRIFPHIRFSNSISIHYHTLWIWYFILFSKVVKQLCVEAAFPACSSVTLSDQRLSENEATLRKIESGEAFESANREIFIAGSSAERVAIEPGWGHGWADLDVMDLYGGGMGVAVYHADQESPSLVLRQDLSPPAYCRIEVKNKDTVGKSIVRMRRRLTEKDARTCLKSYNGHTYLSSTAMVGIYRGIAVKGADTSIESYREQAYTSSWTNDNIFSCDLIPCLVGSDPPMWAHGLFRRLLDGDWPSTETVRKILTYPSVFIMRGDSRYPRHDLMFRQISSVIEILFAKELPDKVRQAYCTFKTCFVRTLHQPIHPQFSSVFSQNDPFSYNGRVTANPLGKLVADAPRFTTPPQPGFVPTRTMRTAWFLQANSKPFWTIITTSYAGCQKHCIYYTLRSRLSNYKIPSCSTSDLWGLCIQRRNYWCF